MLELHLELGGREVLHALHPEHEIEHLIHEVRVAEAQIDYCLDEGEDGDARGRGARIPEDAEEG